MEDDVVDDGFDEELNEIFQSAANHVRFSASIFNQEQLLYLYARFKQANEGKCRTPKPGMFDFQGKKKWESWKSLGDLPKEDAMKEYIQMVGNVDPNWQPTQQESGKKFSGGSWVGVSTMSNTDTVLADENKTVFDWCKEGTTPEVLRCLRKGGQNVDGKDESGMTLLHWTCDRGNLEMLDALLDLGADINLQDEDGQTALHYAVSCEHESVVERLLKRGADVTIKDNDNLTPLDVETSQDIKQLLGCR